MIAPRPPAQASRPPLLSGAPAARAKALGLLLTALACTPAWAQAVLLSADNESATLFGADSPPGPWDVDGTANPGSLTVAAAAAHRGLYGMRVVDSSTGTGAGANAYVGFQPSPTLTGNVYLRAWVRAASASDAGVARILYTQKPGSTLVSDLGIQNPGSALIVETSAPNLYLDPPCSFSFAPGSWALIELALLGVGTSAGSFQVYANTAPVCSGSGFDWSTVAVSNLSAGEPWSNDLSFEGTIDFDDLRLSQAPPASHFAIALPADAGSCLPLTVSLKDSTQAPAAAPYAFAASIAVDAGSLFSDSLCRTSTTTVAFDAGSSGALAFYQPGASGAGDAVTVSYPDFLAATASIPAGGGSGTLQGWHYAIGCSCRDTPVEPAMSGFLGALLALAAAWRGLRRQRR